MRKFLALVLALVMTMSLVTIGANAKTAYTDDAEISADCAEAVEVLSGIGVLNGRNDGSYGPTEGLSRGAAAKIIAYLVLGQKAADKLTATYTVLSDVTPSVGLAAYIEWAYANGIVDGYGDGTFGPYNKLTEFAFGKMLLTALGYSSEKEGFTGAGWQQRVYAKAFALGIFNGSEDYSLCARQDAARMALGALQSYVVVYGSSKLDGSYLWNGIKVVGPGVTVEGANKLDKRLMDFYGLELNDKYSDAWGRPGHVWSYGEWSLTVKDTPVSTHNVATSQCEIASDLGETKTFDVTIYDNGVVRTEEFKATSTAKTEGAQGTLIEVYDSERGNILVVIDTYLAYVYPTTAAKTDAAGHEIYPAYSSLAVYGLTDAPEGYTYGIIYSDEYAQGDYVLVNVNKGDKDYKEIAVSADEVKDNTRYYYSYEIVQTAPYFTGAQTKIWYNTAKHTVDGTTYDDAAHYAMDDAGLTQTESFYWYKDQYGNLIGSQAMDRTSYEVLKSIVWSDGKAIATLIDMTGTERTAEVAEFDGLQRGEYDWTYEQNLWSNRNNDREPVLDDDASRGTRFPGVSREAKYNEEYLGYALYCVTTNDDGTVDLDKEFVYAYDYVNDAPYIMDIEYAIANIDTGSSVLQGVEYYTDGTTYSGVLAIVTADTEILVRNSDGTYSVYNGDTVPELANNAEVFFTGEYVGNNWVATRIYVKNSKLDAELGEHLFVTGASYGRVAGFPETWEMDVLIDGKEQTIWTTEENVKLLAANVGKLFHVEWELNAGAPVYGFVRDVYLINEYEEDDCNFVCCDYLGAEDYGYGPEYATFVGNRIIGADGYAYTVTSETKLIGADDLSKVDFSKVGVWVVYDWNGRYDAAITVYVGTKLDESVALTVKEVVAAGAAAQVDKIEVNGTTITVTMKKDATSAKLAYVGNDANTVIVAPGEPANVGTGSVTDTVYDNNSNRAVTVYDEAATIGYSGKTYTVTLVWPKSSSDASLKSVQVGGSDVTIPTGRTDPKAESAVNLGSRAAFTMVVKATDANATVMIGSGDTLDNAVKNLAVRTSVTVTETTELNGGYIVIRVIAEDGSVQHYVYDTAATPAP